MTLASSFLTTVMDIHIFKGWFPTLIWSIVIIGCVVVLAHIVIRREGNAFVRQLITASILGVVAFGVSWLLSATLVFDAELGWDVIWMVTCIFFLLGWVIAAAVTSHGWSRIVAIILIPFTVLAGTIQVDAIYGEYTTIGSIVNYSPYAEFSISDVSTDTESLAQWRLQHETGHAQEMPQEGRLFTISIPATTSGFKARTALVWLPPAAFATYPPKLPVMVMLAGNPGSPGRYFSASNTVSVLTKYANDHMGLAPIVVSPDQNGADDHNSLCANTTKYGNAETYLTVDVPQWIKQHLPVSDNPADWVIGGFSQGGTCATSLAPNHPDLYGNVLSVDGELQPTDGTVEEMVANDFAGNRAAYERMVPTNALQKHAPSTQTMVIGAGSEDTHSMSNIMTIGRAARKAGWHVVELESLDAGHNWKAVNQVFAAAMPWYCSRMGLGETGKDWKDYLGIEVLRN